MTIFTITVAATTIEAVTAAEAASLPPQPLCVIVVEVMFRSGVVFGSKQKIEGKNSHNI